MGITSGGGPAPEVSTRELMKLGRRLERLSVQRRRFVAKVEELDGSIRECRRLFRQLADALMMPAERAPGEGVGETLP